MRIRGADVVQSAERTPCVATDNLKAYAVRTSPTGGPDPFCLARKWIANCKPVDRLAILHVLRVKCSGASIKRSRDDE
jgi:hypothetical protein